MANTPRTGGGTRGRKATRSSRGSGRRRVEMVALSAESHCGPRGKGSGRRKGGLRALLRTWIVILLLALPLLFVAAGGLGQTTTLDPPPDSPFWWHNAPTAAGNPLRSGHVAADLLKTDTLIQWRLEHPEPYLASGVMDQENAYLVDRAGTVRAVNLTTGEEEWETKLGSPVSATPAIAYGWVYVATEDSKIVALSAKSGLEIQRATLAGKAKVSPLVAEGRVYQGTDAGVLQALDATTLDEVWRFDTATVSYTANGTVNQTDTTLRKSIRATPSTYNGVLYFGAWNGRVYALSTHGNVHGQPATWFWTYTVGDIVNAPVAIDRHTSVVYAADSQGRILALRMAGGSLKWTLDAGQAFTSGVAVSKERLLAGTTDGRLLAVNPSDGKVLWERLEPSGFVAGTAMTNDTAIALAANGTLFLSNLTSGKTLTIGGANATWHLPGTTHATPSVTSRGILITDQRGNVTLLGPTPKLVADLRALDFDLPGGVRAGHAANVSFAFTNDGPDRVRQVLATLSVDGTVVEEKAFGVLRPGATAHWNTTLAGAAEGAHNVVVTFRPEGASDPDADDATATGTWDVAPVVADDGLPRLPDGSIDYDALYGADAPDARDRPARTPSLWGAFTGAFSPWMLPLLLVVIAAGVAARRYLATRAGTT